MIASSPLPTPAAEAPQATPTASSSTSSTTPMIDSTTKERARNLAADAALLLGKSPMGLSPEIAKWLTSKQTGPVSPRAKLTDRIEDLENRIYRKQVEVGKNPSDEKLLEELRDLSNERSKLLQLYWTQYMPVTATVAPEVDAPPRAPPQTPHVSGAANGNSTAAEVHRNREKLRLQMASPATGMAAEVLTQIARGSDAATGADARSDPGAAPEETDAEAHPAPMSPNKRRKRKFPGDTLPHVTGSASQQQQQPPAPSLAQLHLMPPPPPPPPQTVLGLNTNPAVSGIRCQCKKSRCLKLYCDCFAARKLCVPNECRCISCENFSESEPSRIEAVRYVLSKRSDAFQDLSALSRGSEANGAGSQTLLAANPAMLLNATAQTAHALAAAGDFAGPPAGLSTLSSLRGCFCRKSQCLKKYCVCFNARVQCGSWCRCLDCANGRPHDPAVDVGGAYAQAQDASAAPKSTGEDA